MEKTTIEQDRREILLSDGTKKYRIRTAVVDAGELPQLQIFVFQIEDESEPTTDAFIRVGTPYDLENIETDRTTAIDASGEYYLSAEFTRDFDNLDTAKQAKDAIYSRIDDLTRTWYDYSQNFYGEDDLSSHPTASPEFEQQLKDAYSDAKAARIQAESDLDDANDDLETAQTLASAAADIVLIYQNETDFCAEARDQYWVNFFNASDTFKTASDTFFNDMIEAYNEWATEAGDGNQWPQPPTPALDPSGYRLDMHTRMDTFESAFNVYKTDYIYATQLNGAFGTFCQEASTSYAVAVNEKAARDKDVEDAVTAQKEAEAALAAAQEAEAAALSAVLNVCPDFDPTSV